MLGGKEWKSFNDFILEQKFEDRVLTEYLLLLTKIKLETEMSFLNIHTSNNISVLITIWSPVRSSYWHGRLVAAVRSCWAVASRPSRSCLVDLPVRTLADRETLRPVDSLPFCVPSYLLSLTYTSARNTNRSRHCDYSNHRWRLDKRVLQDLAYAVVVSILGECSGKQWWRKVLTFWKPLKSHFLTSEFPCLLQPVTSVVVA